MVVDTNAVHGGTPGLLLVNQQGIPFSGNDVTVKHAARHIGNAVPVLLGRAIGKSIKNHIRQHASAQTSRKQINDGLV